MSSVSLYDRVGGDSFFEQLTSRFYSAVAEDPVLRPLYPQDATELEASRRNLTLFLVQFWGGPKAYAEERGHPRLRMRHATFRIGPAERDAWLRHMRAAVEAADLDPLDGMQLMSYLADAAEHLVNAPT
ncbi:MAG: globin [Acidimicrobiales bacterium]